MTAFGYDEILVDEKLREKNFDAYESTYGIRPVIDSLEGEKFSIRVAKDGEFVLYVKTKESLIRMNSLYSPKYEAQRWAEKDFFSKKNKTILIMGLSTGVYLNRLVELYKEDTRFIVYEPAEGLFSFLCGFIDFCDLICDREHVFLMVSVKQAPAYTAELIKNIEERRPDIYSVITPGYDQDSFFYEICEKAKVINETAIGFQLKWAKGALKNRIFAWTNLTDNSWLKDLSCRIPDDLPAVIVSAGPSLKKNVDVLKKIKGHALIICVDRAVSTLAEHGIVPDVITSVDPAKGAEYVVSDITMEVPLICSLQVNADIQKYFMGRSVFFDHISPEEELFGKEIFNNVEEMEMGGNVSGASFAVCLKMNIRTIILIGQDLAFLNGQHHSDGKNDGAPVGNKVLVEGIDGSMIETTDIWCAFKDFFERQIALHEEIRVIDATEGGALINGTELMTLRQVSDEVCVNEFNIESLFKDLPRAISEEEYENSAGVISKWIDELDIIKRDAMELTEICESLFKVCKYHNINDTKNLKKLKRLEFLRYELSNNHPNVLLEKYWIEDICSIPDRQLMLRTNDEAIVGLEECIKYYRKLPDYCKSLQEELRNTYNL
ncbi:motility associated factor glycosyltransferase family protein [Butyrivibrio sp. INlla16]|uniref:motility associated factor glycosyltransferase family protein n=1 Tax=Butyrivibrio sp. INlla16 TaxID=1520807 RepID=UPI000880D75A|nr:6-hydroxymethylpterin diphosphokinase MptE-like protein [Butyrivibrio sp. INlla16]SDB60044.1 Uncharacterized conserved protein [Butyrivibrio sp. INlla16]